MNADADWKPDEERSIMTKRADEILVLMEENFDAGIEELKKASPLSQRIACSSFEGELPEAYRVFNPRLVARVEKLSKKFHEYIGSGLFVERNQE